ncbi:DNA primase small subunit PriS [Halovenus sp. WSH3]|uniref:DNA primase small subunit PriS n=1 Tax=Halovenus carboxidivorans TaxID=2692199 RepID=A0A6B0TBI5_9EURY|nr:DNA primase small subunit PriS [Halovenus carboxidivorans]
MHERTQAYLRGRFGDHYRNQSIDPPPGANEREWGYVPWTEGPGETYSRHNAMIDLGALEDFLARERPKHVYFSAGRYDNPGATTMNEKGWRRSGLIFDLDADHLPSTTPEDSYAEMLADCKDALFRLLDFLERDFGFEEMQIVFSGSRGYHVHVRDEGIQRLDSDARREIVDYVRGIGLEFDELVEEETVAGLGRKTPAENRYLPTEGGWGGRIHDKLVSVLSEVRDLPEEEALERLQEYDGIGEGRAQAAYNLTQERFVEIERGNLSAHAVFAQLARQFATEVVAEENAQIDEPVSTDTNRLIRLPGSLHGGSGLAVRRVPREEIDDFDPLVDAVPETFTNHEITVEVTDGGTVELGGDSFTLEEGVHTVPEYVGVFLMTRGRAEKGEE